MRYSTVSELQRLVDHRIAESPSLEYKRELHLDTTSQRLEMLKDLSGMGNGGGGTVLFGIQESEDDFPVAEKIVPLTEGALVGKLEDVVRDGIRPPLLMEYTVIEVPGGFVLAVEVELSGLGPYMVQAYGNMQYHRRTGTRTVPMSEQQVRDAYALALRTREHRADLWADHALPMQIADSSEPWITVSALPEDPLGELLDVGGDLGTFRPTGPLWYHAEQFGLSGSLQNLTRWADGLYGHDGSDRFGPTSLARLHRDGAAGAAVQLRNQLSAVLVGRVANAALAYLGWFWQQIALQRPVEVVCRVEHVRGAVLRRATLFGDDRPLQEPPGVPIQLIEIAAELLPWDAGRAAARHRLVRRIVDRVRQAFGLVSWTSMFEDGQLYGQDQRPIHYSIGGAGVWHDKGLTALAHLYDDGRILDHHSDVIAHLDEGVVLDRDGHTVAVVELATGSGCPDDFLPGVLSESPLMRVPGGNAGQAHTSTGKRTATPTPTGRWSAQTLPELLAAP